MEREAHPQQERLSQYQSQTGKVGDTEKSYQWLEKAHLQVSTEA